MSRDHGEYLEEKAIEAEAGIFDHALNNARKAKDTHNSPVSNGKKSSPAGLDRGLVSHTGPVCAPVVNPVKAQRRPLLLRKDKPSRYAGTFSKIEREAQEYRRTTPPRERTWHK